MVIKKILIFFDNNLFNWVVKFAYPQYKRPRNGYLKNYEVLKRYFFFQKILRINGSVPWPVDFRSKIIGWQFIKKGIMSDPGDMPGNYINATGGLIIGDNVGIAANTIIATTNHYKYDHRKISYTKGVTIGNNVWIGANCSLLPGTIIGDEVTIGAGCVISGRIPSKTTVTRSDNHLKIIPKNKNYEWDIYNEELF